MAVPEQVGLGSNRDLISPVSVTDPPPEPHAGKVVAVPAFPDVPVDEVLKGGGIVKEAFAWVRQVPIGGQLIGEGLQVFGHPLVPFFGQRFPDRVQKCPDLDVEPEEKLLHLIPHPRNSIML